MGEGQWVLFQRVQARKASKGLACEQTGSEGASQRDSGHAKMLPKGVLDVL